MEIQIEQSWKAILEEELAKEYYKTLIGKIKKMYRAKNVYPEPENIFRSFELCPFEDVQVVILGQDPYHGPGQAHGLSFSVPGGTKIPPSLRNIYKELLSDVNKPIPESGNLEYWAQQGVLLLNATLTVEKSKPGSHQGLGWETFTDSVIRKISTEKEYVVFLLWGKYAQAKEALIDSEKHLILKASHPSPFSAHKGFLGCKHFSQTNEYLKNHSLKVVEW